MSINLSINPTRNECLPKPGSDHLFDAYVEIETYSTAKNELDCLLIKAFQLVLSMRTDVMNANDAAECAEIKRRTEALARLYPSVLEEYQRRKKYVLNLHKENARPGTISARVSQQIGLVNNYETWIRPDTVAMKQVKHDT